MTWANVNMQSPLVTKGHWDRAKPYEGSDRFCCTRSVGNDVSHSANKNCQGRTYYLQMWGKKAVRSHSTYKSTKGRHSISMTARRPHRRSATVIICRVSVTQRRQAAEGVRHKWGSPKANVTVSIWASYSRGDGAHLIPLGQACKSSFCRDDACGLQLPASGRCQRGGWLGVQSHWKNPSLFR